MRLIDADAFKKYMRDACNEMSHLYKDGGKWAKQITEDFCMDIDEQPTIEPERKTGKWTDKSGGIENAWNYCSVCGEQAIDLYDFCPNCGARMEGEEDG